MARWDKRTKDDYSKVTIGELRGRYDVYQYHAKLRGHSRSIYMRNRGEMKCFECGYNKHVDIAHVREVNSFQSEAMVAEVNAFENLKALCRNHHKEMDATNKKANSKSSAKLAKSETILLKDLKEKKGKKWPSVLRGDSRAAYVNSGKPLKCLECGYDNHVDIAHVKAIKDFTDDATVADVNASANLMALCPNHHWEYDHEMLSLGQP